MTNKSSHIQSLFLKYTTGTASLEEVKELLALLAVGNHDAEITAFMQEQMAAQPQIDIDVERWKNVLANIKKQTVLVDRQEVVQVRKIRLWPRIAVVAAAVAAIVFGVWFFNIRHSDKGQESGSAQYANDIAPGKQGATLTLANGKKIRLSDVANGEIAKEAGISVSKTADGQVVYEINPSSAITPSSRTEGRDLSTSGKDLSHSFEMTKGVGMTNVLSTDRGETYVIILPDKSKVWLNAASSLTYTAALMERGVRRVKLAGEAYFEVTKDKEHPFVVESDGVSGVPGQQVQVLGTHFNVSTYHDDPDVRTTLLEGSVKVNNRILKPNQQSVLSGQDIKIVEVSTEDVVAWKNGMFSFENERIDLIMKKISRWYNIEVSYEGTIPEDEFSASISRDNNISEVLKMLSYSKSVKFKMEGRKITVTK